MLFGSVAVAAASCDALVGIEELSTPSNTGISCTTPADCPPTSDPCYVRACTSEGSCEIRDVEPGYVVPGTTPGDCMQQVCNGGVATATVDPTDVASDGNPCTIEGCSPDGQPTSGFASAGTACADGVTVCDGAGTCVQCVGPDQCNANQTCVNFQCVGAQCNDNVQNGSETDTDCGGNDCPPCPNGSTCSDNGDCTSGVCSSSGSGTKTCKAPSCSDNVRNGNETDIDCGGSCPNDCALDQKCQHNNDCESLFCDCQENVCTCQAPQCDDGIKNGTEVAVDCGPDCLSTCADGMPCLDPNWCQSQVCEGNQCQAPTCNDNVQNGLEDGVDCGGPECGPCGGG